MHVKFEIPEAFAPLWQPYRYKVLYGGRASTKSWTIARVLLTMAAERKLRVLCAREIQNSIQESVHALLAGQIELLNLRGYCTVQKTSIVCKNGSEFFFSGLKHKIDSIKSTEGVDICWVEEAHLVSKTSWDKLTPTIRKPGSEIWISFNPELDTDETYKRFVKNPPEGAWVKKVSFRDNPWFSEEMRTEMRDTRLRSEDDYQNIWLGFTKQTLEGAVYAKELREATEQGRITKVPYILGEPVNTYWDLGHHDMTAIWFAQRIGFEWHIIDYYENRQQLLAHYVGVLQEKKYNYGVDYMPHDADSHHSLSDSVAQQFQKLTGRKPVVLPRENVEHGINLLRTLFPQMYFDEDKCADGLQSLRHYHFDIDEDTGHFSKVPVHDIYSHASDALRYLAMSNRTPRNKPVLELIVPKKRPQLQLGRSRGTAAWMGR